MTRRRNRDRDAVAELQERARHPLGTWYQHVGPWSSRHLLKFSYSAKQVMLGGFLGWLAVFGAAIGVIVLGYLLAQLLLGLLH